MYICKPYIIYFDFENSEANTSELLENVEKMFPRYN